MASAIPDFTPTIPPATTTSGNSTTGNSTSGELSSSDFIQLMITQLEQQDPTNPTDSNQILTQLSQISTLQSNNQMQTSLQSLTLQQSIGAGGNLIGKTINGVDATGSNVSGIVTGITVQNQQVSLTVAGTDSTGSLTSDTVPMANVISISPTSINSTGNTTVSSAAQSAIQSYLSALTNTGNSTTGNSTSGGSGLSNVLTSILGALGA